MALDGICSTKIFEARTSKEFHKLRTPLGMAQELGCRGFPLPEDELRKLIEREASSVFSYSPNSALDEMADLTMGHRGYWKNSLRKAISQDSTGRKYLAERCHERPRPRFGATNLDKAADPNGIKYVILTEAVYLTPQMLSQVTGLDRSFFDQFVQEHDLVRRKFAGRSISGISAADSIPKMVEKQPDEAVKLYNFYLSAVRPLH